MTRSRLSKEFFFQPVTIFSLVIFLLWAVIDFSGRIIQKEAGTNNNLGDIDAIEFNPLQVTSQQKQQVMLLYERYKPDQKQKRSKNPPATVKKAPVGMSSEQQEKQQGLLKELYIDDKKLELKAVINDSENKSETLVALLLVTEIKTTRKKLERFINKSLVYGYTLDIVKNTRVTLSRSIMVDDIEHTQTITLIMYQTGDK